MADNLNDKQKNIQTAIPDVPVTIQRPPFNPIIGDRRGIPNAGTARVNKAVTVESPGGTAGWAEHHSQQTVLQQHCAFFDTDGDGIVWPHDTFLGLRKLGFNVVLSITVTALTHALFSYATCAGLFPDIFFRVFLDNIHRAKHGSDSGVYDNEGRFVPQKFEDFFSKYGRGNAGIILDDIWDALKGQHVFLDPVGTFGTFLAWVLTYMLLWPDDGFLKKDDVRRVFDGSIFPEIAENVNARVVSVKKDKDA